MTVRKKPDFTSLSLGAGLQSSVLVEMVVEGELRPVDVVIFADTGDEPAHVYEQVWYLAGRLQSVGIPLCVVNGGDLVDDIYNGTGRFASLPLYTKMPGRERPGMLRRQCTKEYKIQPIEHEVRRRMLRRGMMQRYRDGKIHPLRTNPARAELWLGITVDEAERMKPNVRGWITNRYPLVEKRMNRQACINWLTARGLPVPDKSSCKRCPFHSDGYWMAMREERPEDWQEVVKFDRDLRGEKLRERFTAGLIADLYVHRSALPLEEAVQVRGPALPLDFCDGGYCHA